MSDPFAVHRELTTTFRFYIALTVFANLGYVAIFAACGIASVVAPDPYGTLFLIPPAMVSTGFAALAAFGIAEAIGLHRAIQSTGRALDLPHITRSMMLPVQTILTLIFHLLFSFILYAAVFFGLIIKLL